MPENSVRLGNLGIDMEKSRDSLPRKFIKPQNSLLSILKSSNREPYIRKDENLFSTLFTLFSINIFDKL